MSTDKMTTVIMSNGQNVEQTKFDRQNADQTVCQETKRQFFFVRGSAPTPGISQLRICKPPASVLLPF